MSTVNNLSIPRPVEARRPVASWRLLVADGVVAGGIAGLATFAAITWAPWWLLEIVGFLTAPLLLAMYMFAPHGVLAAAIVMVAGSMLLYSAYAVAIVHCRTEGVGAIRFMVILLIHAACLIAWIGMVIGGTIDSLPL